MGWTFFFESGHVGIISSWELEATLHRVRGQ